MTTPETANLQSFKQELKKLRADNESLRLENTQLQERLDGKTAEFQKLTERVTEAERSIQAKQAQSPNAALVDRIRRLELRNSQLEEKFAQTGNGKDRHTRQAEEQC